MAVEVAVEQEAYWQLERAVAVEAEQEACWQLEREVPVAAEQEAWLQLVGREVCSPQGPAQSLSAQASIPVWGPAWQQA